MSANLTGSEVTSYRERGYVFPKRILSEERCQILLAELNQKIAPLRQESETEFPTLLPPKMGDGSHPLESLILPVVHDPVLGAIARDLVDGELLVRNVDLFVKEARTVRGLRWHMDTDYGGENPDGIVTAWIALTPSRHANGALWFAPCSHRRAAADAMTEDFHRAAQAYLPPVQVRLSPGEASFHHGRLLHSSGANQTDSSRVGLAIRFFGSRLAPEVAQCGEPYFVSDSREEKQKVMEKAPFPFTWWSSSAKHGES